MSLASMPWPFSAAISRLIRSAFRLMAAPAVLAWTVTPRLIVAMSGVACVSP
jgi:hypothetical protein